MINNSSRQRWQRAEARNLDAQFTNEIIQGMNCSPFEAEAIRDKVHQVYDPLFENSDSFLPGQIRFMAIDASVPPNIPLALGRQRMVILTLDAGVPDLEIRRQGGVIALRQRRLARICEEAFQQGGLLTLEGVADLFNCSVRTLVSDLSALRKQGITLPLRSTVKDMGRAITHRALIIEKWLSGLEYSDISKSTCHSVSSVANYISKFKRCVALFESGHDLDTVAFIAKVSTTLAKIMYTLYKEGCPVAHRRLELDELAKKNNLNHPPMVNQTTEEK
jgi:hypothetical protein